ncbi:hypothetical protein TL08_00520 [Actinoalloteichus hymeniacidonis]|uniref:Uncharacterized protein n=1 Tax=Actinoalloteichus hymeniacidonis TaxID=340345 RepID=A0AAC9HKC3_9PSEU|nr:hypothetical protein TL08_00520 [Actinoalloteichus hymeniacidonis]
MVCSGNRTGALLDHMGQLMGKRVLVCSPSTDDYVVAGGVSPGADLCCGPLSSRASVQPHVGEVGAKAVLHLQSDVLIEGTAS